MDLTSTLFVFLVYFPKVNVTKLSLSARYLSPSLKAAHRKRQSLEIMRFARLFQLNRHEKAKLRFTTGMITYSLLVGYCSIPNAAPRHVDNLAPTVCSNQLSANQIRFWGVGKKCPLELHGLGLCCPRRKRICPQSWRKRMKTRFKVHPESLVHARLEMSKQCQGGAPMPKRPP
jgi:hypothetical protein